MRPVLTRVLLALAVAVLPLPAASESVADSATLIARMNHAGYRDKQHCTAALVGAGHLVTAAHCLPEGNAELAFLFGYDRGEYTRLLPGRVADFRRDSARDVAVWCHAAPDIRGFPAAEDDPALDSTAVVVGYGIPLQYKRQSTECPVLEFGDRTLLLGCQVGKGTSGAPALGGGTETPQYLGAVSASGGGQALALRVTAADLERLCGPAE